MDELTEVAVAVADPVRREILVMLRHAPLTAGEIAARFTISRPAVSRHLRVLRESGLVRDEQVGRHRRYSLVRSRLGELAAWLTQFDERRPDWAMRLAALDTEVHRTRRDRGRAEPADTARHSREDTA
ncbi:metalloregulator ArsR/SmtB family transcription factor [Streptomyces yerevanensis]|uniref:metalloregulator ArsR/SmtB family transcription factor n=1 Tax=Streptomyces yerevanensis TaxID=66378 RepID=UPI000527DA06|nr:metalloregulator ArsR/SmtB family transcription factor [Streptomyces yerevanensis]